MQDVHALPIEHLAGLDVAVDELNHMFSPLKLERGHAAPPPISVMNSRRFNGSPLGLRLSLTTTWNDAGASKQNWLPMSEMGH